MAFYSFAGSEWNNRVFGTMTENVKEYISNQYEGMAGRLHDTANQFFSKARETFVKLTSDEARRQARSTMNKFGNNLGLYISRCETPEQFANAGVTMQNWLMANPKALRMRRMDSLSGYSPSWVDMEPNTPPEERTDYKEVTDGVWMDVPGEDYLRCTNYLGEDYDVRTPLLIEEKMDILDSWGYMDSLLSAGGVDPTSLTGEFL